MEKYLSAAFTKRFTKGISTQCATVADTMDLQGDQDMRRIEDAFLR